MENNSTKETRYNDKQVAILAATEKLLSEKGYAATSVREIAAASHVNVAMISYYFGSKEKLLEALFVQRMEAGQVLLQGLLENKTLTPLQKLEILVNNYVDKMVANPNFYQILSRETAVKEVKEISKLISETKKRNLELMNLLIAQGQEQGEFVSSIDVHLMMHTLFGTLISVATNCDTVRSSYGKAGQKDEIFWKKIGDDLKRHMLHLIYSALTRKEPIPHQELINSKK
jgi:AcrR family transcriptional regulator